MSGPLEDVFNWWTARGKSALVIEIIRSKTTVAEASRSFNLSPSQIEGRGDDAQRGMENALRANPLDVRQEYEKQLRDLQAMLKIAETGTGPAHQIPSIKWKTS